MFDIEIKKTLQGSHGEMDLAIKCVINKGEFVALWGKSGSGKTTFLRILAGLEKADGHIEVGGSIWQNEQSFLAIQKRNIGFVFQNYALFENMTVEENLLFVNNEKKLAKELLEIIELSSLANQYPKMLSGGQQQRVALCRALMSRPKLLLLDEALSALDRRMRLKLQDKILELHNAWSMTTIMVSHDASEVYRLASRVLLLENGKIRQDGKAKELMMHSKDRLEGELLSLDNNGIATVLVGQQLVELTFSKEEACHLKMGQVINLAMHKIL